MTAKVQKSAVSVALALAFAASSAVATPTYVFNSTANSDVPSLTGFSTTGAMMDGMTCLLYTSPSPRDRTRSRMPSSA